MLGISPIASAPIAALASSSVVLATVAFGGTGSFGAAGDINAEARVQWYGASGFRARGLADVNAKVAISGRGVFLGLPYMNTLVDSQHQIERGSSRWDDGLSTTVRPGALTFDYRRAFTLGPVSIGDPNQGILGWAWYVRVENGVVYYARSNDAYDGWQTESILFTFTGDPIVELDTCFEQNGRIVVVAQRSEEIWLYWYKPSAAAFVFEKVDDGRTPRTVLDNPNDTSIADVHIAYIKDGSGLLTRRQSELYATPHVTNHPESSGWFLEEFARNRGNRLVAILSRRTGDRYSLARIESTLYPFYPQDKMTMRGRVLDTSELVSVIIVYEMSGDDYQITLTSAVLNTSTLAQPLIIYDTEVEDLTLSGEVLDTSTLTVVIIIYTMYDIESLTLSGEVLDTSTLRAVLITHEVTPTDHEITLTGVVMNTSTLEIP